LGDPDPDLGAFAGNERRRRPRNQNLLPAGDEIRLAMAVADDLHLVCGLLPTRLGMLDGPRQARDGRAETEHAPRITAVLEAWRAGRDGHSHV
jgi:hypothetical protein